ncbi:FadR/GntR family transcriptional regulator [Ramlibacter sp.]|uniref:FadR/GntR family transcriptional regulator n=1 Tax=Ramlibacter sp. TaxID=1917967 RepID=UPI003D0D54FC
MNVPEPASLFKPVRRRTFEDVATQIRDQIASGGLKEGDKLPPERTLAEALGVSRNTVREALRSLEYAGLLELKPGMAGGAYIRNGSSGAIRAAFDDLMSLGALNASQLTEARVGIAREVARLACKRYTEAEFAGFEDNFRLMREAASAGDLRARVRHNVEFHRLLAASARNPVLLIMTDVLVDLTMNFVRQLGEMPNEFVVESRERIMAALRDRDVERTIAEYEAYLQKTVNQYLRDTEIDTSKIALKKPR